jgi:lysophospholipase L1-like esterase
MRRSQSRLLIALSALSVACSGNGRSSGDPSYGGAAGGAANGSAGSNSGGTVNGSAGQAGVGASSESGAAGNGSGGQTEAGATASSGSGGVATSAGSGGTDSAGFAGMLGAAGALGGGGTPSTTWTGTWASSPQGCSGNFNQKTMREIVHTSVSGTSARVRVSNTFSGGSLQIRDVHVAQRTSGASIDPATDKPLTFNGQAEVIIPAGMSATSDGVPFTVKALSDVAVSFYVVSNNGATCHRSGFQTNYSADGDSASSATLAGAQTNGSYYFLSNLDVLNPDAEGAVVTLGASITDGFKAPSDANQRWPNDFAVRLVMANRVIGVLNQGISGDGVANAVARFDRDVLSQPNVKWVIFSDNAINDFDGFKPPAQTEIDKMKTMMTEAHAKGVKFLCSTLTPHLPAEPGRSTVNAFIRGADSGCDGIVDQDTATHDPAAPMQWLPAFNSGDSLHPNVAGLQAIANAVQLDLFK